MNKFKTKLIVKVILLTIVIGIGFFSFYRFDWYVPSLIIFLFALYLVYDLIQFIQQTNKHLARFISSIQYSDFSQTFGAKQIGNGFDDLMQSLNTVMDKFRKERNDKEEQYRFLQTVIRHIGIGLICFDRSGKIEFFNQAALKLLGINRNISSVTQLPEYLEKKLVNISPGEKIPIKLYSDVDISNLLIYATEFKMRDQNYKLVSVQNIRMELEEKELEAWQKLIRVLTHEIMNSVTPISSLASTVNLMLAGSDENSLGDEKKVSNIKNAIKTIEKRSEGLIDFVNNYRNLTKIPRPNFEIVPLNQLFSRLQKLFRNDIEKNKIDFTISIEPESLEITADPALIEQVLINLMLNSIHAVHDANIKKIDLSANLTTFGKINIKVADTGPGIDEEIQEKIFIPFFSTKKDGTGIGLSLAKQIMNSHGGEILVKSQKDKGTVFYLVF